MKRAYSYIRFSTPEQLQGKSLERQTEAARNYCKQHTLELDTELSLRDLGVSAFRGKNSDTGALGSFLKAVHVGQVPKGSFLLIETFDRMSRESAYDAQLTLQNIINAGITVVTLLDGKQYNVTILRADPLALIYAILLMSRSHEESSTKSKRVADAWRRKREDLKKGKMFTLITPGWITRDKHLAPKPIPERVKIVRRIFNEAVSGVRLATIASSLNEDRVPTFRHGQWWSVTVLKRLLTNRAVLGEFQPCRIDHSDPVKQKVRVPTGEPIKNYWPRVVDEKLFKKAQATLGTHTRQPSTYRLKNILAGLACCSVCGGRMERTTRRVSYLVCARARAGAGCEFRSVRMSVVEAVLTRNAGLLAADVPDTTADLQQQITALESEIETLQRRIVDMAMLLSDTPSRTVAARIQQDEAECGRLQGELASLKSQALYGGARRVRDSVLRMRSALKWHATDPSDTAAVNAALRECFDKIIVNLGAKELGLHWRQGHTTALSYAG
jgi:DNA invertase Pin-like site-specific DNA recombinase